MAAKDLEPIYIEHSIFLFCFMSLTTASCESNWFWWSWRCHLADIATPKYNDHLGLAFFLFFFFFDYEKKKWRYLVSRVKRTWSVDLSYFLNQIYYIWLTYCDFTDYQTKSPRHKNKFKRILCNNWVDHNSQLTYAHLFTFWKQVWFPVWGADKGWD